MARDSQPPNAPRRRPRRGLVLLSFAGVYLVGLAVWLWSPLEDDSLGRLLRLEQRGRPAAAGAPSRATRRIRGKVVGLTGSLRGLEVVAVSERRGDVLAGLGCSPAAACACGPEGPELARRLRGWRPAAGATFQTTTLGTGFFQLELDDAKDTYAVWVESPGRGRGVRYHVRPQDEQIQLPLSSEHPVAGRVLVESGTPSDVLISAIDAQRTRVVQTTATADGSFELGPLPEGEGYTLIATAPGLPLASVELSKPPWSGLTLSLRPSRRVEGRVVRASAGVASIRVELVGEGCAFRAVSGLDGRFAIDGVRPGQYAVRSSRGVIRREDPLAVPPGRGVLDLELDAP